jgi:hypothetical protein
LQEMHGGMWSKWSKGAWTWLKAKASSGRTNNASKGVDERVWAVQLVEHTGTILTKGRSSRWRKDTPGEARSHPGWSPRSASISYKWHPPMPVFCRQATLFFPYLCPQVFKSRTTLDLANLPKLFCSNNSHS